MIKSIFVDKVKQTDRELIFHLCLAERTSAEGNLYAREWYLALNNRGDRHFHSDYEFLRDRDHPFFLRESSFQRLSRHDGKLRPVVYTAGKVASSLSHPSRQPRTKEPVLKDVLRRPVATSQSTRNYWDSCSRCRMRAPTAKDALDLKWPLWNSRSSAVVAKTQTFGETLLNETRFLRRNSERKGEERHPFHWEFSHWKWKLSLDHAKGYKKNSLLFHYKLTTSFWSVDMPDFITINHCFYYK